ncbi:hypothetical protein NKH18_30280 [Streptomyces sp. M10(2022)]
MKVSPAGPVLAVEVHSRQRFSRIVAPVTLHPPERDESFAELQRVESDLTYRALFLSELNAAMVQREAELYVFAAGVEAAAGRLRNLVRRDSGGHAV